MTANGDSEQRSLSEPSARSSNRSWAGLDRVPARHVESGEPCRLDTGGHNLASASLREPAAPASNAASRTSLDPGFVPPITLRLPHAGPSDSAGRSDDGRVAIFASGPSSDGVGFRYTARSGLRAAGDCSIHWQRVVAGCRKCAYLAETRTQTVFGTGPAETRLMFVGEAPGADEDRQGKPFVGRAGQF